MLRLPFSTVTHSPEQPTDCPGHSRHRQATVEDAFQDCTWWKDRLSIPTYCCMSEGEEGPGTKVKTPFQTFHHTTRLHTKASGFLLAQHHLLKMRLRANKMHACVLTLKCNLRLMHEPGNVSRTLRTPFVHAAAAASSD